MPSPTNAPAKKGAYALLIDLGRRVDVEIGGARHVVLAPGLYVYAGSAYGPGGIAGRLARHLRRDKRLHWHVDRLTVAARHTAAFAFPGGRECDIVGWLLQRSDFSVAAAGFGSSDCRTCSSHLLQCLDPDRAAATVKALGGVESGSGA